MRVLRRALPVLLLLFFSIPANAVNQSWTGKLASAPANAKEGVVATITCKEDGKDVVVTLWAEGEIASTLKAWASSGTNAKVTGARIDDTNAKITAVEKVE
jgi:hypothetical protein